MGKQLQLVNLKASGLQDYKQQPSCNYPRQQRQQTQQKHATQHGWKGWGQQRQQPSEQQPKQRQVSVQKNDPFDVAKQEYKTFLGQQIPFRRSLRVIEEGKNLTDKYETKEVEFANQVNLNELPLELLERIFAFLDTWSKGAVSIVCKRWNNATKAPAVWRNAMVVVRNPVWVREHAGLVLASGPRTVGAEILGSRLREGLARKGVNKAILAGPNIHHEKAHLAQLAIEMPTLETLVLFRCPLGTPSAVRAVDNAMVHLKHLVVVGGWSSRTLQFLREMKRINHLTLIDCEMTSEFITKIALPFMTNLQRLSVRDTRYPQLNRLVKRLQQTVTKGTRLTLDMDVASDYCFKASGELHRRPYRIVKRSRSVREWDREQFYVRLCGDDWQAENGAGFT
eukprot:m.272514 g.272514  ORF g.272514 m.272514 type:complete len:396 (+) comp16273_c0_seq1:85-1272(+)